MSRSIRTLVKSRHLPALQKRVAEALAGYSSNDEHLCWPSVGKLAAELGISERAVQMNLRKLEAAGLVSVSRRESKRGADTTNLYTLHEDAFKALPTVAQAQKEASTVHPRMHPRIHRGGERGSPGGCTRFTPVNSNYLNSRTRTQEVHDARGASVIPVDFTKRTRMRYDIDDGPDQENPFARHPAGSAKGPRQQRDVSTWNNSDLARDFAEQATRFYPMRAGRCNVVALAGAIKDHRAKTGASPELVVSMTDAFFADRRSVIDGVELWKQFIKSFARLEERAKNTLHRHRDDRQGTADGDLPRPKREYDPLAEENAWRAKHNMPLLASMDELEG